MEDRRETLVSFPGPGPDHFRTLNHEKSESLLGTPQCQIASDFPSLSFPLSDFPLLSPPEPLH